MSDTRVFFVVDSIEDNEEIFETLEQAEAYMISALDYEDKPRVYVAYVRNAFREKDGSWNYDDLSDTFTFIQNVYEELAEMSNE